MTQPVVIVLTDSQLARLARHTEAQKARTFGGLLPGTPASTVTLLTRHFDDILNVISAAKSGEPDAICATSYLWQHVTSTEEGRRQLALV